MMSEADSGDLSPSLVEGEVSHHTRPGECEVDSDPPPPANNRSSNSALDNSDDHSVTTPAVADVNNSTLNTSEEIGTTADLEDCDIHSEQDIREEELDVSDEVPEIKSKLSFKEESEEVINRGQQQNRHQSLTEAQAGRNGQAKKERPSKPAEIKPVNIGNHKLRSKLKFDVVTAKVVEEQGRKHVAYTIMMKRASGEVQPAVICRRYNDFCYLYERILCTFHPSILGEFQFPKKVLLGNFKAETITERTDAFHKFLNLIASSDKLLYSDYFHAFLCSDEQNEAVSYIKLGKYDEAAPLLETIFYIREKLVTISHVTVLECVVELVACLAAIEADDNAYRYALVAAQCLQLLHGHPEVDRVRIPFLRLASSLAVSLGHDPKPYNKQLSELRYSGIKTEGAASLLEVIRDKYIHTATRTARAW